MLPQIPSLKHVIYVDEKKFKAEGYPETISIHSMQAVQEQGKLPENSVYFYLFKIFDVLFSEFGKQSLYCSSYSE